MLRALLTPCAACAEGEAAGGKAPDGPGSGPILSPPRLSQRHHNRTGVAQSHERSSGCQSPGLILVGGLGCIYTGLFAIRSDVACDVCGQALLSGARALVVEKRLSLPSCPFELKNTALDFSRATTRSLD
jgi:hypothetical protein